MILALHNDSFLIPFSLCRKSFISCSVGFILQCPVFAALVFVVVRSPWLFLVLRGLLDFQAASGGGRLVLGSCGEPRALPRGV